MFTGIIEETGKVGRLTSVATGIRLRIDATLVLGGLQEGDSICVNGVCLTATTFDESGFTVDVVPETLQRSNLGALEVGNTVNLERPMRADGRLDGHIVQGHVDGTGTVTGAGATEEGGYLLEVAPDPSLMRYIVEKGSITIDGVSLTVAAVGESEFAVALIPHTLEVTNLGQRGIGALVNLEVDVIAKYVERLMEAHQR